MSSQPSRGLERLGSLALLAARQHGLFTTEQARQNGVSAERLAGMSGSLVTRRAPRIYQVTGSVDTFHQRLLVPVLQSNHGLASHRAAAALWRIDGFADWERPEILIPRWTRRPRQRGTIVHESTSLADGDASFVDSIPTTSVVRTLIDLCAVSPLDRVGSALDDACRRGLTDLGSLRQRFVELDRRGRPGRHKMRVLLAHRPGGDIPYDSVFEAMLLRLLQRSDLPNPVCQHPVDLGDTTVFLDFAWPEARVGVECDSEAYHSEMRRFHWDRERRNRLEIVGWAIRSFTWKQVKFRADWVVEVITTTLDQSNMRQSMGL